MGTLQQIYNTVVEDWLQQEDIADLELKAISNWHSNATIKKFLAESTLAGDDNPQGDGDRQGLRLRIDLCRASGGRLRGPEIV